MTFQPCSMKRAHRHPAQDRARHAAGIEAARLFAIGALEVRIAAADSPKLQRIEQMALPVLTHRQAGYVMDLIARRRAQLAGAA